jgi:hypothetical protein
LEKEKFHYRYGTGGSWEIDENQDAGRKALGTNPGHGPPEIWLIPNIGKDLG